MEMSMPRVEEDDGEQRRRRKLEEALEVKSLRRIISAYLNYPDAAEEDVKRYERSYNRLPPAHKALLLHYPLKFQRIRRCISTNSFFIFSMLQVRCIVRNLVRDWAAEGQKERDQCYKPILEELDALFCNREKDNAPTCLVPGAGLGRLALEISCLGFICQGNEFSYYMMICSSFILNHAQSTGEWTIYPWVHSNCNSLSDSDQLRPVLIPDIHPASAGITEGFSMCGGDFVEVYSDPSQVGVWDVVVTCFFIDTAHNIIEYIEIISRILKDGGVWINMGPLLYHFADMYGQEDEMSIELSLEDVKRIALHYGFHFEKEKNIETTYTTNPRSMMQNRYYAAFWTARKKMITKEQHIS
ncbi:hypothetical protein I3760_04G135100 [Carya illinoinensis]|nr:hypothetical protein I3760_04G135100 [Carya illinoinensis]